MEVPHLRCNSRTIFKVKDQGHQVRRAPYLPNGKAYKLQTLVYWSRTTTRISHRCYDLQSKRSHDQYEPCWPNDLKIENEQLYHQSLHLVLWRSTKMHITDSRSDLKGQGHTLTSSMSHLCLLLIRETKCCTCVVRGGCQAGHTMSTEPGNYTSLYMSHSSRFYAIIWDMRK